MQLSPHHSSQYLIPPLPHSPIYRTGDLARWLPDGNIEFLSRIDLQVKIRGFRIELEEIQAQLTHHDKIKDTIVISKENENREKYLCAYCVSNNGNPVPGLRDYLSQRVPEYMIPSYFIFLEQIPLTHRGKIDREALPEPGIKPTEKYEAPRNETEERLAAVWSEVLGIERIGITDNFFEIGGDSIIAIRISASLKKYRLTLNISDIFQNPTIKDLSKYVKTIMRKIPQGTAAGTVPLTTVQKWFFESDSTDRHHFNQAVMLDCEPDFDKEILEKVFTKLVEHHDALRMVYHISREKSAGREEITVIQENRGIDERLFDLKIVDLRNMNNSVDIEKEIKKQANLIQSGIHLEKGPLVKLGLFKTPTQNHLLIAVHHLVIDGISWRILLEDLNTGYSQFIQGEKIEFPGKTDSFQYWSEKLNEYELSTGSTNNSSLLKELNYWQKIETVKIDPLPLDFEVERNKRKHKYNDRIALDLQEGETNSLLKEVNRAYNTEINHILLTALGLAVKEWAGLEKLAINLEGHGREPLFHDLDISRTIGWFTAQYPVILDMTKSKDLSHAIRYVKETLKRIPNKGIGYGLLKYIVPDEKKTGPPFHLEPEINFNYLGQFAQETYSQQQKNTRRGFINLSRMKTGESISPQRENKYTLDINGMLLDGRLSLVFTYNKYEYKRSTIQQLVDLYREHLLDIIGHCIKSKEPELTPSDMGYSDLDMEELEKFEDKFAAID